MAKYYANHPVKLGGKRFEADQEVTGPAENLKELVECGAVRTTKSDKRAAAGAKAAELAASNAADPEQRAEAITAAMRDIHDTDPEHTNPALWTNNGAPECGALSNAAGFPVSASERDALWADVSAALAAEAQA